MSKPIRYDSLLVRDLAAELHATLSGAPLHAVRFDRDALALVLQAGDAVWHWALHPTHGALTRSARAEAVGSLGAPVRDHAPRARPARPARPDADRHAAAAVHGNVLLPRRARIAAVRSLPDERIVDITIMADDWDAHGGVARRLLVELLTNQWNAIALAADDRIAHVLRPRTTAARTLQTGDVYVPPQATSRAGADRPLGSDEWLALIGAAERGSRVRTFVRGVAYASPLNAPFVIGAAEVHDDALRAAYDRYIQLVAGERRPCVLPAPNAGQPYGVALDENADRFASLLDAFAAAAGPGRFAADDSARIAGLENAALQVERTRTKARRLRAQLGQAPIAAAQLRRAADLLLAQLHRVPKNASHAELDDFEGGMVRVELDPQLTATENATQLYTQAKKRERAAARLPQLIAKAEREAAHWQQLHARIESGTASDDDIAAALPTPAQGSRRARNEVSLPYRVYRTTGGLEVRVGRGAKGNDALTLRHSSGNDFWLHARDVGGAHVILRWPERDANPPHSDLIEAATLAALHSKGRTSKLVPVDYTRRKYVRKPRKAPPGRVVFERGKTVFVEPDAELEEAMRGES